MAVRILLADDHTIVRQGLRALLEREGFDVVGEAADGLEAVRLCETLRPEVAIFDVGMPLLNGIGATREIAKTSPRTKSILLTMHTDDHFVLNSLRAGAVGYVLKEKAYEELVHAIRAACKGEIYLSSGISRAVVDAFRRNIEIEPPEQTLSDRERQVLQLVAEGKTTKEVAALLNISVKTAEAHRTNIMAKLNIHDVAGLVRYAVRIGLIQS